MGGRSIGHAGMATRITKDGMLFLPPAACALLCSWQIRRSGEKQDQIDEAVKAVQAKPVHLHELRRCEGEGEDLERVTFDAVVESPPLVVQPRMRDHKRGCLVVQKVRVLPATGPNEVETSTHDPTYALWLRGWAPWRWCQTEEGTTNALKGGEKVHVDGVKRSSETPSRFALENDPNANAWHWIDAEAMSEHLGMDPQAPLVEQMSVQEVKKKTWEEEQEDYALQHWPKPRGMAELIRFPVMPDGHRQYAMTWAALGLATGAMAVRARKMKWTRH